MALTLVRSILTTTTALNTVATTCTAFTPTAGNILVVKIIAADSTAIFGTPTATGHTFVSRASSVAASNVGVGIYTAVVPASPGSITVSVTWSGGGFPRGFIVEEWSGGQLATTPATNATKTGTGAPSATVTTTAANSIVTWCDGDWAAIAPGTPAYRSSATEDNGGAPNGHGTVSGQYTYYYAYQTAATAGAQTIGLTAPTGQTWTMLGIEIQLAGGGTAYTPSQADAVGIIDSAVTNFDNVRSQTDAVGITDAATPAQSNVRSQADAVGITDSCSAVITHVITGSAADPIGITDSATTLQASARAQTDAVGITDTASFTQVAIRTQADAVGITDSCSAVITTAGTGTHILTTQTPQSSAFDSDITVGTQFTVDSTQSLTALRFYKTLLTDSQWENVATILIDCWDASGTIIASGSHAVITADPDGWIDVPVTPVNVTSGQTYTVGYYVPAADSYPFTSGEFVSHIDNAPLHGVSGCFTYGTGITKPVTTSTVNWYADVTLASSGGTSYTPSATDPVGITDSAIANVDNVRSQSDAVGITDSAAAQLGRVSNTTDPVGITDSATFVQTSFQSVTDAVGITDSVTAVIVHNYSITISDSIGITDTGGPQTIDYVTVITDAVGIVDVTIQAQIIIRQQDDPVGIVDTATPSFAGGGTPYTASPIDPVGITDQTVTNVDNVRSVADPIGITDAVVTTLVRVANVNDPIGVVDQAVTNIDVARSVIDPVGITDQVIANTDFVRTLADPVGITDSVTAVLIRGVNANDAVGITDSASDVWLIVRVTADPVGITDSCSAVLNAGSSSNTGQFFNFF